MNFEKGWSIFGTRWNSENYQMSHFENINLHLLEFYVVFFSFLRAESCPVNPSVVSVSRLGIKRNDTQHHRRFFSLVSNESRQIRVYVCISGWQSDRKVLLPIRRFNRWRSTNNSSTTSLHEYIWSNHHLPTVTRSQHSKGIKIDKYYNVILTESRFFMKCSFLQFKVVGEGYERIKSVARRIHWNKLLRLFHHFSFAINSFGIINS